MGILKPMGFDAYAYQMGTFPIAASDSGKVKDGMFCKLNDKKEVCIAAPGEKGFMVLFPKSPNRSGFAILQATFYVGDYTLNIDEECFDSTKTYEAQQPLYVGAEGKLTNDSSITEHPVPVAQVLRPAREVKDGVKALGITSFTGLV